MGPSLLLALVGGVQAWGRDPTPPPPPPPPPPTLVDLVVGAVPLLQGWDAPSLAAAVALLSLLVLVSAAIGGAPEPKRPWPTGVEVHHSCPGGERDAASLWQRFSGAFAATAFTLTYILVPCSLVVIPVLVAFYPYWWFTWTLAGPFVLSALLPPFPSRTFLQAWPFCHMPKYFNFSEIRETTQ